LDNADGNLPGSQRNYLPTEDIYRTNNKACRLPARREIIMGSSITLTGVAAGLMLLITTSSHARNFDLFIDNLSGEIVPIEQRLPQFPGKGVRRGQEGWVHVHFVVTPDGRATDPVIVDSVGGVEFEKSVRDVVADWTFEPTGDRLVSASAVVRFETYRGRDLATSNFLRRYKDIVRDLHNEEFADAREKVDETAALGGWNLYESTMLWLMIGRIEGAEGNDVGKLEAYRRALAINNRAALNGEDRQDLLQQTFELEMGQSQYAAARKTLAKLEAQPDAEGAVEELAGLVMALEKQINGDAPITARATLFSPAGSAESESLWVYEPLRRTFSFAALNGNVERFEVRCERNRLDGAVAAGQAWTLPDDARDCRLFVFGDDGASFDFVEYAHSDSVDTAADAAVATNDGLDR
jgi:TonB family protein